MPGPDGSRLPRRYPRLRRLASRALDLFPLTPLGALAMSAAALAVAGIGLPRTDLVILVLGGAALGAGALALLLTSITALGLWIALRRRPPAEPSDPLRMECGVPSKTGFSLPSLRALPLVQVRWSWVSPEASVDVERRGGRLFEAARPSRRLSSAVIERRVEVGDALRLTKIAFRAWEGRSVRALPSTGALRRIVVAKSASSGSDLPSPFERPEGEPVDMRRYTPGDPMRLILWKTFARSRQVVVRAPEQAVSPARRTAAYLIAGDGDEAAAGAARAAVESMSLGATWILGADGADITATRASEAIDVLTLSGRAPPEQGGVGLDAFLKRHAQEASTRVVLFTPPSPGPWLERATKAMKARAKPRSSQSEKNIEVFVCIDGLTRRPPERLLSRLLFVSEVKGTSDRASSSSPPPPAIAKVLRALTSAGAAVTLADRRAGRTYAGGAQRALLAAATAEAAL